MDGPAAAIVNAINKALGDDHRLDAIPATPEAISKAFA